jgi:hypothetical protein
MQGHRLCRISISLVILASGISLVVCGSAVAAASSVSQLRRALARVDTTVHLERNHLTSGSGVCSATTAQGQISLIEMMRGQDHYLPSTTCEQAVSEAQQDFTAGGSHECLVGEYRDPFIKSAIVRIKGKRATVRLVEDFACPTGENLANGAAVVGPNLVRGAGAVRADPIGVSHWIKRRGRWFFNNEPTGTYSPAGMKAAAQLRAALSGGVITEASGTTGYAVAFCVNGSSNLDFFGHLVPGGPWYVAGGLSVSYASEPPFDPLGNPQGAVFLYQPAVAEWDITLVGGRIVVASASMVQPVFQPGAAGC